MSDISRTMLREAVGAARRKYGSKATLEIYLGDAQVEDIESFSGKLTWPTSIFGMRTYHVHQPSYLRVRAPAKQRSDS